MKLLRFIRHVRPRYWWLTLLVLGCMVSCRAAHFYGQAAYGQAQILWRSKPISQVIEKKDTSEKLRQKLLLVEDMRQFASESLSLPGDASFGKYCDLGRRYVSWVIYAAPEFSVEPKSWWYPLVGRLQYRGFFSEAAAKKEADQLKAQGLDVYFSGVEAYSTLGWFHDPILNTFVDRSEAELAELIFHELTHVKLFLHGDTEFNEALATAVGEEGVRRWFKSRKQFAALQAYEASLQKDAQIVKLLLNTRQQLQQFYAQNTGTTEEKRAGKAKILQQIKTEYSQLRERWQGDSRYDRYFAKPINNARLNTIATYYQLVPAFAKKLQEYKGDLPQFFVGLEKLRDLSAAERRAVISK